MEACEAEWKENLLLGSELRGVVHPRRRLWGRTQINVEFVDGCVLWARVQFTRCQVKRKEISFLPRSSSLFLLPSRLQPILKSKQLFRREPETRLEVSFLKRQEERGDGSLGTDSKHFFFFFFNVAAFRV